MAADLKSPVAKRRKVHHHHSAPPAIVKSSTKYGFTGDTMEAINEKELWLLAVPIQFNVEELNGMVVDLNASKDFEVKTGDDDKVTTSQYSLVPQTSKEKTCFPFMSSGEKPGRLTIGRPFKGELTVQRSLTIPDICLSPTQPKNSVQFPTDLKQRWRPFGVSKANGDEDTDSSPVKEIENSPRKNKKKSISK